MADVICLSDSDDDDVRPGTSTFTSPPSKHKTPQLRGLHKNPSGQTTLAFDSRVRKRKAEEVAAPPEDRKRASLTTPITTHFRPSPKKDNDKLILSITKGQGKKRTEVKIGTEVKIVLHENDRQEVLRPSKTARKTMRSFVPRGLPVAGDTGEPELITLDDDDDDEQLAIAVKESQETEAKRLFPKVDSPKKKPKLEEAVDVKPEANQSLARIALNQLQDVCRKALGVEEQEAIEKKLVKRLKAIPEGVQSEKGLKRLIDDQRLKIEKDDTDKLFVHLRDLLDRLESYGKHRRTIAAATGDGPSTSKRFVQLTQVEEEIVTPSTAAAVAVIDEASPQPMKKASSEHIRKLEQALAECHAKIKELGEAEVESDEEEENAYVKECQYKKKCVEIYKKIAQLRGDASSTGRKRDKRFKVNASRIPEINAKIGKFINQRKHSGKEYFPDYSDILQLYKCVNQEKNLGMSSETLAHDAKETFTAIGEKLKDLRVWDEIDCMNSYLPDGVADLGDPADNNEEIANKLQENAVIAKDRMNQVLDDFARAQATTGEVPEEVPDNEPEEEIEEGDEEDLLDD